MNRVLLACAAIGLCGWSLPVLAQAPQVQPQTSPVSPRIVLPAPLRPGLPTQPPPGCSPRQPDPPGLIAAGSGQPPSEIWGNVVFHEPDGSQVANPSWTLPTVVYFRTLTRCPGELNGYVVGGAGQNMERNSNVARYHFYLEQRPGEGGARLDPARPGVIYDPQAMRFVGFVSSTGGRYTDPNTGAQVQYEGLARARPDYDGPGAYTR